VELPPGTLAAGADFLAYDLVVHNPDPAGCQAAEAISLTMVAPPAVVDATPDIVCLSAPTQAITITGSGFLVIDGSGPTVTLDGTTLTVEPAECTALEGPTETVLSCTSLVVTIPDTATPGLRALAVQNPTPAGCVSGSLNVFLSPRPQLTDLSPPDLCSTAASTIITATGTDLLRINSQGPGLTIGSVTLTASATDCQPVAGLKETLEVCTTLTATLMGGGLMTGSYPVGVANPPPASCAGAAGPTLEVVPPPTVASVTPNTICAGGGALLITGTGFRPGAEVTLGGSPATTVTVVSPTEIHAAFGSLALAPGGPYPLTVENLNGCAATLPGVVSVTAGPQIFFVDPPVAYNGLTTQLTIYGSGLSAGITSVSLRPTGTTDAPTNLAFTWNPAKPNRLQATVPSGTAAGQYDILVSQAGVCDAWLVAGLKLVYEVTLLVVSVTPSFGHTADSTAITVQADPAVGGGFQPVPRLYLNPQTGTQAATLRSVTFVDPSSVTAVVPSGLPVDTYDLIAVNPDGGLGLLPDAFRVTTLPPPAIAAITPGSIPNRTGEEVTVDGANFRSPAALLRCYDVKTATVVDNTPAATNPSATQVTLTVDGSVFPMGAVCIVRITNGDDGSYDEYLSLVVTNLSQNLTTFAGGPPMSAKRRALASVTNRTDRAARFIYAIGGDGGTTSTVLGSVEVAPVDIFGKPGAFFTQRHGLVTARSFHGAAAVGRCLYVVGGVNDTTLLASVERACVLDPEERPEVADLDLEVSLTDGLGGGLFYYQVAALTPGTHPLNPNGETLPSEPFPVLLPTLDGREVTVTVYWSLVSGATGYRIYRSPAAGAAADALELIATVGAVTSYTDTGAAATGERPHRRGSTGPWQTLAAALPTPRQGAGVALVPDPGDPAGTLFNLYVVGGLEAANQAASECRRLPLTLNADGSQTAGSFADCGNAMRRGRWQLALMSVGHENASFVTPPTRFLYAVGGVAANGQTLIADVDAFEILSGGGFGTRTPVDDMQPFRAGFGPAAVNNILFTFGGVQANHSDLVSEVRVCESSSTSQCTSGPPDLQNWSNSSIHLLVERYLLGSAVQSGYIYILGGTTDTESASSSTEYTIW
jgi:hypothetical protein